MCTKIIDEQDKEKTGFDSPISHTPAGPSGRSLAETVGSNPTGGMDVCLLWVLCDVRLWTVRRADHSSREVLPIVVRRCVLFRNVKNEETMARVGSQRYTKIKWLRTERERGIVWRSTRWWDWLVNWHVALHFVFLTMAPWGWKYVGDNIIQNIV
jgi:hypothetical protein